jgi:hypothetical protein
MIKIIGPYFTERMTVHPGILCVLVGKNGYYLWLRRSYLQTNIFRNKPISDGKNSKNSLGSRYRVAIMQLFDQGTA